MISTPLDATLAHSLQSLAESQLQSQLSRRAALDATAAAIMGLDAVIAAAIGGVGAQNGLSTAAVALLGLSFSIVATVLLTRGADDMGPLVTEVMARRSARSDQELVVDLLDDLAARIAANQLALSRKEPRITAGLVLTLIGVLAVIVGQLH